MLQVEVDHRYTALQVLDHPWVNVSLRSIHSSFMRKNEKVVNHTRILSIYNIIGAQIIF